MRSDRRGSKRRIAVLQNLAILVLSLSAALLLIIVGPLELTGESGLFRLGQLISQDHQPEAEASDLSAVSAPINLVISNSYGRRGELLTTTLSESGAQCGSLIREAIGSAHSPVKASREDLRDALGSGSIFMDFLYSLPSQVVASFFGAEFEADFAVRCLLLASTGEGNCTLFFWNGEATAWRYGTAVPEDTLLVFLNATDVNGAWFAFEAGEDYDFLYPFTLLPAERVSEKVLSAVTSSTATDADRLLSVTGFNVHTNNRYPEEDGTQVIVESPRTLRIHPDGVVEYMGDTETAAELFWVPAGQEEAVTSVEAVLTALRLAETLMPRDLSGNGRFFITGMTEKEGDWQVTLGVHVDGVPVYHVDAANAMEIVFTGNVITAFTIHCRSYTAGEDDYALLPLTQTVAMAEGENGAMLTVGYVDRGNDQVVPVWLLQ